MKKQIRRKKEGLLRRIVKWLFNKKLLKNKVYALILMTVGYLSMFIEMDCTGFVFTLLFGLPVFFSNENVIND